MVLAKCAAEFSWLKGALSNISLCIWQWNEYASTNGIRLGVIFNGMFLWAIRADGNNNILLSQAYRYNATNPTVLQVCFPLVLNVSGDMFA
jgi:hypothetical protein